jgi:hypothetical protein
MRFPNSIVLLEARRSWPRGVDGEVQRLGEQQLHELDERRRAIEDQEVVQSRFARRGGEHDGRLVRAIHKTRGYAVRDQRQEGEQLQYGVRLRRSSLHGQSPGGAAIKDSMGRTARTLRGDQGHVLAGDRAI